MAGRPLKTYNEIELNEKIITLQNELKEAKTRDQKKNIYSKIAHWKSYKNRKEKDKERYLKYKQKTAINNIQKYAQKINELKNFISPTDINIASTDEN